MEMEAYIYNDEKGDDISVAEIPEDMKDEAELYHTELVEKICELDDDLMMEYLEGEEPSVDALKAVLQKSYMRMYSRSGMLWYCIQKQRCTETVWMQSSNSCLLRQISRRSRAWMMDGNEVVETFFR